MFALFGRQELNPISYPPRFAPTSDPTLPMTAHSALACASTSRSRSARKGFTLIELLTVIAIIGVLAAILIPTVGMVKRKANQAKSVSNLRQLGNAMRLFANDNKDYIPAANYNLSDSGGGSWDELLFTYLNVKRDADGNVPPAAESIFFHPSDKAAPNSQKARRSYAMPRGNTAQNWIGRPDINRPFYRRGANLARITAPSQIILLTTRRNNGDNSFAGSWTFANIDNIQTEIVDPEQTDKLNGGGSLEFLMVDGSVKVMRPEDTWGKAQFGTAANPKGYWPIK